MLVGHNVKNFDCKVLYNASTSSNMNEILSPCIVGFLDTLSLFRFLHPDLNSYKQENLVTMFVKSTYNAHDALADVKALESLMNTVRSDKIMDFSFSWEFVSKMIEFNKMKASNMSKLNPLVEKKILSKHMAGKVSASGLNFSHLALAHKRCSAQGIYQLFTESGSSGKSRVTSSKGIISKLTDFLSEQVVS